jgi:hypothetical protein
LLVKVLLSEAVKTGFRVGWDLDPKLSNADVVSQSHANLGQASANDYLYSSDPDSCGRIRIMDVPNSTINVRVGKCPIFL